MHLSIDDQEDTALATRVILVRHGTSTYNVLRKVQGHCDESDLTEGGQQDAAKVGVALQGIRLDAAYSSPLKRATQTAQIILEQWSKVDSSPVELQFTDNLKEINLLHWEGMTFDDIAAQFPEDHRVWRDAPHDLCLQKQTPEGTEPFYPVRSLFEQAKQFWRETLPHHADQTILVVAHSGIIRSLVCTAIGLEPYYYKAFHQSNCAINVLNFGGQLGDPVQIESYNLTAHLGNNVPEFRGKEGIRMLLVRHGETQWNREKRFQGQIDVPLNPHGQEQGRKTAQFLQEVPIDRAVTSPLLRPKETAELILEKHPDVTLELSENLKEISHGLWEGKLESEIALDYATELDQWKRSPHVVQMPEGENLQQVWERAIAAWQEILESTPIQPGKVTTVMVVAHDAINKAILCHLADWGPEQFWVFKQGNGAVSVIDYAKGAQGRPLIQALNITSHVSGGVLDRTAAGAL